MLKRVGSSKKRQLTQEQLRIVGRFLVIYFLALLVPLVSGTILYFVQIRQVEQEILSSRANTLELNKRVVESAILSIEEMITEIRQDEAIASISIYERPIQNRLAIRVANAHLESRLVLAMPEYVLEVVVYLARPDLILTNTDVYFDTELYYEYFLGIQDQSYRDWRDSIRAAPYVHSRLEFVDVNFRGHIHPAIAITSSLPYTTRLEASGSVTAYIDLAAVEELLATYLAGNEGFARIELPDGRTLAAVGAEHDELTGAASEPYEGSGVEFATLGGREYAVSYIRSDSNKWLYVSGIPIEVFFAQSRRIRFLFVGLLALLILVGVPIVLWQVYRMARPIAETSRVLRDGVVLSERVSGDPFSFISDSVDELVQHDRALRALLAEQQPLVKNVILERLFRGDYKDHHEAETNMVHFGIEVPVRRLMVFCILIEGYFDIVTPEILAEFTVKSALLRDELDRVLPETALIHNVSHSTICVALFMDDNNGNAVAGAGLHETVTLLARQLRALRDVRCTVTAGGYADDLSQVSTCIQRAIHLAEHSAPGSVVAEENEKDSSAEDYYYPTDLELSLVRAVRSGQPEAVAKIKVEVLEQNFAIRSLSREGVRRLHQEIEATRRKIEHRLSPDLIGTFEAYSNDLEKRITRLLEHFQGIAQLVEREGIAGNRLKEPIRRFVDENALDPEMGLKLLALHFNLSEVYLSRLFRELFGENFHSYVERTRMEAAERLLRSTTLTIEQIADRVGYTSANTFRRVFKRNFSVSPSSFERSIS